MKTFSMRLVFSVSRNEKGHYLSEAPLALMVVFFLFVFPLIDLGTIAIRWGILMGAAREGAHAAAVSPLFATAYGTAPSATAAGAQAVQAFVSRFSGVSVTGAPNQIDLDILATNIASTNVTRFDGPLPAAADTLNNVYSYECRVRGTIQPFIDVKGTTGAFGLTLLSVPGLNAPVVVEVRGREIAEAPSGLNQ